MVLSYEYSAKERMGIDKYSREVLRFPYTICHLGNTHMLNNSKLQISTYKIILSTSTIIIPPKYFYFVFCQIIFSPIFHLIQYIPVY